MTAIDLNQIVLFIITGLMSIAVYLLWALIKNIVELNNKIAIIIERVDNHEKRLDRLEDAKVT